MSTPSRRDFLQATAAGLVVVTATGELTLRADAVPTPAGGDPEVAQQILATLGDPPATIKFKDPGGVTPTSGAMPSSLTRPNPLGPFFRDGAPFRGKSCPPFEAGTVLIVSGRVWGHDAKKPLAGAVLDVWHVDVEGHYSAGDGDYKNRARLITSESGYYEFEAIHPVAYEPSRDFWRSPHIHFKIARAGYKTLVTELFFKGDPKHDVDSMFHAALEVPVEVRKAGERTYETAWFDIVLEAGTGAKSPG